MGFTVRVCSRNGGDIISVLVCGRRNFGDERRDYTTLQQAVVQVYDNSGTTPTTVSTTIRIVGCRVRVGGVVGGREENRFECWNRLISKKQFGSILVLKL